MQELLKKLNRFTRREMSLDEVYIFSVILCDNDVDRDYEKFSLDSLNRLKDLYVGKTGIFDHNTRENTQTARIFSTELVEDNEKLTLDGEIYTYLKADAYIMKTSKNADLIKEIEGGIKKEVSVSCKSQKKICSVCGSDVTEKPCIHKKGRTYGRKLCFHILEDITDAYEWSFVSVPCQRNAGVTKTFVPRSKKEIKDDFLKSLKPENHLTAEKTDFSDFRTGGKNGHI